MSAGEKGGSTPTLAPENYKTRFASACALYRNGTDWYKGSGIHAPSHPLASDIDWF